jgi:hypothetical protein
MVNTNQATQCRNTHGYILITLDTIQAIGLVAKFLIAENNVLMYTTLFQGQKEARTQLKTLWGYAVIVTMKYTSERN